MPATEAKTIKATVAKGRSLFLGGAHIFGGSDGKVLVGTTPGEHHSAGAEVEVPAGEYESLVAAGYLVDPDAPEPKVNTGPVIQKTA